MRKELGRHFHEDVCRLADSGSRGESLSVNPHMYFISQASTASLQTLFPIQKDLICTNARLLHVFAAFLLFASSCWDICTYGIYIQTYFYYIFILVPNISEKNKVQKRTC